MEQNSYTPEPEPSSVEIALDKVNEYRSTVDKIESDESLSSEQKNEIISSKVQEYLETIETLPSNIQRFAMYVHSAEDEWPDSRPRTAA